MKEVRAPRAQQMALGATGPESRPGPLKGLLPLMFAGSTAVDADEEALESMAAQMPLTKTSSAPASGNSGSKPRPWVWAAAAFCFVFGILYILNIQPVGDGLWYWYATMFRQGSHLYRDMHLNLQPFFILLTALGQRVLGSGWLASKGVAVLQLVVYLLLVVGVVRRVPWRDWQRGVLLLATFGLMLTMKYFRLDDYHITTQIFALSGVLLLLRVYEARRFRYAMAYTVGLGLLCGVSTTNRINDGALLFGACFLALPFCTRHRRVLLLAVLCVCTVLGMLGIILLTGDSVGVWFHESIQQAARIKGGTGNILLEPLRLPFFALRHSKEDAFESLSFVCAAFLIGIMLPLRELVEGQPLRRRARTLIVLAFVLLMAFPAIWRICLEGVFNLPIATALINPVYALNLYVLCRMGLVLWSRWTGDPSRRPADWRPQETLLLLPFLQLVAGAMTAGNGMPEAAPAIGITLLLMPIAFPQWCGYGNVRRLTVTFACFIAAVSFPPKWHIPYTWHHYVSAPMFSNRVVYHHPTLGWMLIGRPELSMMKAICSPVQSDGTHAELLSMPYPYPNYFCGVTPWHGYVQTWYDTSGEATVRQLMGELETDPPKWVVYQRALDSMKAHEDIFLGGRPLPHRMLDAMILDKVHSGAWDVVVSRNLNGAEWYLIRTHS